MVHEIIWIDDIVNYKVKQKKLNTDDNKDTLFSISLIFLNF